MQTPSPLSRRRGGCRGARLQIAWCKRAGRTGDSRPSCAKKGRRPDGGRYKSSLADASLPGYPSMRSGNPFVERTRSASALRLFTPVLRKVFEWIHLRSGAGGGKTRGGGGARWAADSRITWLILPVVICLSQRLSHACVSINSFVP